MSLSLNLHRRHLKPEQTRKLVTAHSKGRKQPAKKKPTIKQAREIKRARAEKRLKKLEKLAEKKAREREQKGNRVVALLIEHLGRDNVALILAAIDELGAPQLAGAIEYNIPADVRESCARWLQQGVAEFENLQLDAATTARAATIPSDLKPTGNGADMLDIPDFLRRHP